MADQRSLLALDLIVNKILEPNKVTPNANPAGGLLHEFTSHLRRFDSFEHIPLNDLGSFTASCLSLYNFNTAGGSTMDAINSLQNLRRIISDALKSPPTLAKSRFPQIKDGELRGNLERDMLEAEIAIEKGLWKACMVLCGAVLEAAIYDFLRRNSVWTMKQTDVPPRRDKKGPRDIASNEIDDAWTLDNLIKFMCDHNLLPPDIGGVFHSGLRKTRNLIHPAAVLRKEMLVEAETALLCLSAVNVALKRLSEAKDPT